MAQDRESSMTVELPEVLTRNGWALEIHDDEGMRRVPLLEGRTVVGSSTKADLRVIDDTVSSRHCAFVVDGRGVAVEDLTSRNGTFVGSARVREAWTLAGAVVTLGRSTLLVAREEDEEGDAALLDVRPLAGIVGQSIPMRRVAASVRRFARYSAPVLVAGETGTGKELIARALHQEGPRAGRPFVVINVAALPRELVESELFGHERGSFTGATGRRAGAFAEAEGGTLFLDEIGELPLDAQPKLLRALDGYEVRRVGSSGSGARANVRVVAASHVPLEERVESGSFRRDLFHRLEVLVVRVPPLRERPGDVSALARRILADARTEVGPRALTSCAVSRLTAHEWPGNVRELRNVLLRAADHAGEQAMIDGNMVERALRPRGPALARLALTPENARAFFARHQNNLSAAARAAGYPRTTFRKLLHGG